MATFLEIIEQSGMEFPVFESDTDYDPNRLENLFPQFSPNLQKSNISDGLFVSCLTWLHSLFNIPITRYPFESMGNTLEEYSKHATCVPMEVSYLDAETLIEMTGASESITPRVSAFRIRDDLIVKVNNGYHLPYVESLNLLMVRTLTTIPVPQIRQVTMKGKTGYLVMENIPGRTLRECWDELSIFRQFYIAWTLRGYVKQLRSIRRTVPGNLDGSICQGVFLMEDGAGPFWTYSEFVDWFNHKLEVGKRFCKTNPDTPPFDKSYPLVFTHNDISMRNVILGDDGKVYLVDWAFSGFYPAWMEYAAMAWYLDVTPRSWSR
ncbi:kinase-like domain-containing protein [Abortiporus biennis]|nr:kinase-like domain-containing protein [Abortiporus biennis]